jgi:hypothetical protein
MPVKKATPAKKAPAKKAAAPAKRATASKVAKGDGYECRLCGYVVVVDEACGCVETHEFVCCGKPMKVTKAKAAAKAPVKAKVAAKPVAKAKIVAKAPAKKK